MAHSGASSVEALCYRELGNNLIDVSHSSYDSARRVWNGMIDRRPSLIARCTSPEHVRAAVKLASLRNLKLSVRGGGHNVAGNAVCDGGIMVDLSLMKGISVHPETREAIASPGLLWGEFDSATYAHGLACTGGQVSHTGIAGLTLGGGLGYLMGKHGAACDNLVSADLVTAGGETLTCSSEQNEDLFWAVRGAGANFGIVTSFRYRLHPIGQVLAGLLLYPLDRASELVSFYRDFIAGTPDELETTVAFFNSPDGMPLVSVIAVYAGPPEDGERILQPLRRFGAPVADLIRPMSYPDAQRLADEMLPIGDRYYWKSSFGAGISDELALVLSEGAKAMPSARSMILLFEIKGEIQRVPSAAMAFDQRNQNLEMSIIAHWTDPANDDDNIRWARRLWESAQPFVSRVGYINHMTADEPEERVRSAYGDGKYNRLAELKRSYDPENLFCSNHNIQPAQS